MSQEPENEALAVWYLPGRDVPVVVMTRIDAYEEEEAPLERWFAADQFFTSTDESTHGFTWKSCLIKFANLNGPYIFRREQGTKYERS